MASPFRLAQALLYGTDTRQSLRTAQSLLALVVYTVFAVVQHGLGPADLEAAIERAHAAMYAAKNDGRDRAVASPQPHPPRAVAA